MLVLRRNCGQSIVIGKNGEIEVKVLKQERGVVSIGVGAPKSIPVDRLEVFHRKQANDAIVTISENRG